MSAARDKGAEQLLAQRPVIGILQHRLDAGARQADGIGRVKPLFPRQRRGGGAHRLRHAFHPGLIQSQHKAIFLGQHIAGNLKSLRYRALFRQQLQRTEPPPARYNLELAALGQFHIQILAQAVCGNAVG